jgi:hypothetical protein
LDISHFLPPSIVIEQTFFILKEISLFCKKVPKDARLYEELFFCLLFKKWSAVQFTCSLLSIQENDMKKSLTSLLVLAAMACATSAIAAHVPDVITKMKPASTQTADIWPLLSPQAQVSMPGDQTLTSDMRPWPRRGESAGIAMAAIPDGDGVWKDGVKKV